MSFLVLSILTLAPGWHWQLACQCFLRADEQPVPPAGPENLVFRDLVEKGLPVDAAGKDVIKLPPPTMADGLDAEAQRGLVRQVAGPNRRIEDLMRNTPVAPFVLKIEDLPGAAASDRLRRVNVWYVAYGPLERFFSESFFEDLLHLAPREKKSRFPVTGGTLSNEELRERKITIEDRPERKERYYFSTTALFDRVLLSATRRVMVTRQPESVLMAATIDPRFTDDAKYANRWRPIQMDESGTFTLGPPEPYTASGVYTKITRLKEPPGALFIEHRQAFVEPHGWFGGKNLLRSKLPLALQDGVRKLRRQLRVAEESP